MHRDVERLATETFDIVIVGGGMHGAWVAMRAAHAGCRVALIEQHDFAAGTTANSLKILHGGLRYLQHLDLRRMRRSVIAQREFARCSPHLLQPLPCVMPLQAFGVRSPWLLGPALLANDVIGWDRNVGVARHARLARGRLLGARDARRRMAGLNGLEPTGAALWWDAIATDIARLTLEPILSAADAGAAVANRIRANAYLVQGGVVHGVAATDALSGQSFEIRAPVVVDATGPDVGRVARASGLAIPYQPPSWIAGLNVVIARSFGLESAVALSAVTRTADSSAVLRRRTRELFFVPWRGATLVGTEYSPVPDPAVAPKRPPPEVVSGFLQEIAATAPRAGISAEQIALMHWGLLPADRIGGTTPIRKPIVAAHRESAGAEGLIVVIPDKLTTAPEVSKLVLALAARSLPRTSERRGMAPCRRSRTESDQGADLNHVLADVRARLEGRFGNRWQAVARHAQERPDLLERVHPDRQVLGLEIVHAIRNEMAGDLEDVVLRRLGLGDLGHPGTASIERCAAIAAQEFRWNAEQTRRAIVGLDAWFEMRRCHE
jgi:glycerol-3-phosphate dehydrogenase